MPFEKGHKKYGGRKKGSVSQKKKMWDEMGSYFVNEGAERAMNALKGIDDDGKFLSMYMAMLEYFKPKQQRQEVKHELDETITEVEITIKR
jgi:hypothetical protein